MKTTAVTDDHTCTLLKNADGITSTECTQTNPRRHQARSGLGMPAPSAAAAALFEAAAGRVCVHLSFTCKTVFRSLPAAPASQVRATADDSFERGRAPSILRVLVYPLQGRIRNNTPTTQVLSLEACCTVKLILVVCRFFSSLSCRRLRPPGLSA